MRKLWPPKVEGVKKSEKKPLNIIEADSQTPKKILLCCFFAIKVPK
jgi:hypothetical protein